VPNLGTKLSVGIVEPQILQPVSHYTLHLPRVSLNALLSAHSSMSVGQAKRATALTNWTGVVRRGYIFDATKLIDLIAQVRGAEFGIFKRGS